jgi:hypothetical protein
MTHLMHGLEVADGDEPRVECDAIQDLRLTAHNQPTRDRLRDSRHRRFSP